MEQITILIQTNTHVELITTVTESLTNLENISKEHKITESVKMQAKHTIHASVLPNGILAFNEMKTNRGTQKCFMDKINNNKFNYMDSTQITNRNYISNQNCNRSFFTTADNIQFNSPKCCKEPDPQPTYATQAVQTNPWMKNASTSMNDLIELQQSTIECFTNIDNECEPCPDEQSTSKIGVDEMVNKLFIL